MFVNIKKQLQLCFSKCSSMMAYDLYQLLGFKLVNGHCAISWQLVNKCLIVYKH